MDCPERKAYKDWPIGQCKLNTKSCVKDTNGQCEYWEELKKELEVK